MTPHQRLLEAAEAIVTARNRPDGWVGEQGWSDLSSAIAEVREESAGSEPVAWAFEYEHNGEWVRDVSFSPVTDCDRVTTDYRNVQSLFLALGNGGEKDTRSVDETGGTACGRTEDQHVAGWQPTEAQIKAMVDRFLGWKLPADFRPDAGISFTPEHSVEFMASQGKPPMRHEPSGTNLFDARQADAMVRHMLAGVTPSTDGEG
jgi:hypothetical protein